MSQREEEFGVGMTMTRLNEDGEKVAVRDRRVWARVDMLVSASKGDTTKLEALRDKAKAELAQLEARVAEQRAKRRASEAKAHGTEKLNQLRAMAGAYDGVIELYRSGAA